MKRVIIAAILLAGCSPPAPELVDESATETKETEPSNQSHVQPLAENPWFWMWWMKSSQPASPVIGVRPMPLLRDVKPVVVTKPDTKPVKVTPVKPAYKSPTIRTSPQPSYRPPTRNR